MYCPQWWNNEQGNHLFSELIQTLFLSSDKEPFTFCDFGTTVDKSALLL